MNMNKSLLITYNVGESFPLIKSGNEANIIVLPRPLFNYKESIDVTIHEYLKDKILNKNFDKIFIPISLSEDYLNFTGIYFGLHLRLSSFINKIKNVPIIFYADKNETKEFISSYSNLGYFLFTKGVYLIEESKEEIIKYSTKELESISNDYIKSTLPSKIILSPPAFYDNRHSIANEWALLLLDSISGHNILKDKPELQEIQSNLYVKWLMIKNGIQLSDKNNDEEKFLIRNTKGKRILLIDDEWNKGWLELFKSFLGHKVDDTIVDYIHIEKNSTEDEINEKLEVKLQEEWDLFLLDIRLTDNDHKKDTDYFEYTGFTLLETIIDSNSGNQVILMSASNKHRLYNHGFAIGAVDSFIKPGIESSLFLNDLNYFKNDIHKCFERKILREVHDETEYITNILTELMDLGDPNNEEFIFSLVSLLKSGKLAFKKIDSKDNEELGVIFISYFKIFEIIGDYFVQYNKNNGYEIIFFEENLEEFWVKNEKWRGKVKRKVLKKNKTPDFSERRPTTFHKIAGILKQILTYNDSEVINIYDLKLIRDRWVHPQIQNVKINGKKVTKMVDKDMCVNIFKLSIRVLNDLIEKYR